jgi:DNA replication protein DnaC
MHFANYDFALQVISLLDDDDDDDDVPSAPVAKAYPRAQPYPQAQSYAQAQPYVQAQQYPQAKPYPQSQPYPQGQTYPSPAAQYQSQPPGLYAGSYAQPFEIDALQAPPPVPQYTPIYNPVDQRQSQVSYSDFHGQFVELDAPQPSPLSQTHNSEHGYFTPEWKTEQLEAHMEAYPDDPLAGPKLKEAWLANLRYKEAQERDTHMRQQTSSTPPKSSSSFKKLDLAQYRRQEPKTAAADIVPIVEPTLCKEQADLVGLILSRTRNVFYTGSAGCGKSTVLKAFVKRFEAQGMKVNILAPTGRAALDINGTTTWTYAGWTPDHHKKPLKELKAGAHGKFVRKRLCETDVLVLDEISMIENLHLERLNAVMKEARNSDKAFGGVQLVVTGDFCQLPPVRPFGHCIECGRDLIKNREETEYKCRNHGTYYDLDKWAFRSEAWKECDFVHVNLTTIHRQSDKVFIDM